MRRRWNAWRRRQPSLTRYAVVPAAPRLAARGIVREVRVVELRAPSWFCLAALALLVVGCGSSARPAVVERVVKPCASERAMADCLVALEEEGMRREGEPQPRAHAHCERSGAEYECVVLLEGSSVALETCARATMTVAALGLPWLADAYDVAPSECDRFRS